MEINSSPRKQQQQNEQELDLQLLQQEEESNLQEEPNLQLRDFLNQYHECLKQQQLQEEYQDEIEMEQGKETEDDDVNFIKPGDKPNPGTGRKDLIQQLAQEHLTFTPFEDLVQNLNVDLFPKEKFTRRKKFDKGYIKRPLSAYALYSHDRRPALVKLNPQWKPWEVSSALGAEWKNLSPEDKKPYIAKGRKNFANHMKQYPDYNYHKVRPVGNRTKKAEEYEVGLNDARRKCLSVVCEEQTKHLPVPADQDGIPTLPLSVLTSITCPCGGTCGDCKDAAAVLTGLEESGDTTNDAVRISLIPQWHLPPLPQQLEQHSSFLFDWQCVPKFTHPRVCNLLYVPLSPSLSNNQNESLRDSKVKARHACKFIAEPVSKICDYTTGKKVRRRPTRLKKSGLSDSQQRSQQQQHTQQQHIDPVSANCSKAADLRRNHATRKKDESDGNCSKKYKMYSAKQPHQQLARERIQLLIAPIAANIDTGMESGSSRTKTDKITQGQQVQQQSGCSDRKEKRGRGRPKKSKTSDFELQQKQLLQQQTQHLPPLLQLYPQHSPPPLQQHPQRPPPLLQQYPQHPPPLLQQHPQHPSPLPQQRTQFQLPSQLLQQPQHPNPQPRQQPKFSSPLLYGKRHYNNSIQQQQNQHPLILQQQRTLPLLQQQQVNPFPSRQPSFRHLQQAQHPLTSLQRQPQYPLPLQQQQLLNSIFARQQQQLLHPLSVLHQQQQCYLQQQRRQQQQLCHYQQQQVKYHKATTATTTAVVHCPPTVVSPTHRLSRL